MTLDFEDMNLISQSISMRANWIETGDPVLSAGDLHNQKRQKELKHLDDYQLRLVLRLRELASTFARCK